MKTRYGFVSNSSSSSFILDFENVPKSKDELQKLLFGERKEYHDPYSTEFYLTDDVADMIWNQLKEAKPATKENILETIKRGYPCIEDWMEQFLEVKYPEFDNFKDNDDKTNWDEWEKEHNKYCEQFMYMFDRKDRTYFIVEFSDNEGKLNCAIEHGDAFDRIHPFRVSHH